MSASYFTLVHILVLVIIFIISILFFILIFRVSDKKMVLSLSIINIVVCGVISIFLMLVLDKYTKKGVLQNTKSQRILRNESIVFRGSVKNVGMFKISACTLTIKLINNQLSKDNLGGGTMFKSSGASLFSWLFKDDSENEKPNTVEYKFKVGQNLLPGKSLPFNLTMPFPPYFTKTMTIKKLVCY